MENNKSIANTEPSTDKLSTRLNTVNTVDSLNNSKNQFDAIKSIPDLNLIPEYDIINDEDQPDNNLNKFNQIINNLDEDDEKQFENEDNDEFDRQNVKSLLNKGSHKRSSISSNLNPDDIDPQDNDDSSIISEICKIDKKKKIINGIELSREQKQRIKKITVDKLDQPTCSKLLSKCVFKRISPGPFKLELQFAEVSHNQLLNEHQNEDASGFVPSWDTLKPMFFVLMKLFYNSEITKPRSCLEIGTGLGILGIFFRKLMTKQLCRVDLMDYEYDLINLLKFNVLFNNLGDRIQVYNLDLMNALEHKSLIAGAGQHLILASDQILSAQHGIALAIGIINMLDEKGIAIISHKLLFSCVKDKQSPTCFTHAAFDSGIESFKDQLLNENCQVEKVYAPDMGDIQVQMVSKDYEMMREYADFFFKIKDEGFSWDVVHGQVCEDVNIPMTKIKFEGKFLYNHFNKQDIDEILSNKNL